MINELKIEWHPHIVSRTETGVLYIATHYATVTHQCCCGCGRNVITTLSPKDYRLTFDGTVSLEPAIVNSEFPCKSRYFIKQNRVEWC